MTAEYVTLVLDLYDAQGNPIVRGTAQLTPSTELPDPAEMMLIGQAPQTAAFRSGSLPQLRLVSTDSVGPQPDAWTYSIGFTSVPGDPSPFSFYLRHSDGATQYLSALAQVPAAQPGAQFVPLPNTPPGSTSEVLGLSSASPLVTEWVNQSGGVTTFNGRSGAVTPQSGDYSSFYDASGAAAATASSRLINNRGAIAASTAYNPGDVVSYRGQRVLITTATTSSAWSPWFSPPALTAGTYIPVTSQVYYAADWGVVMDGTTDNGPALNRALQYMFDANAGGFLVLPGGSDPSGVVCGVSSTVIIPPNCFIVGQGVQTSTIRLNTGANCDVIQFQTFLSSSQTAIINAATGSNITAGSLRNAFYSGLMHLTVDGNQGNQGKSQYNYGVNMTTNPLNTTTGTDPGFDPTNLLFNVEVRGCTGDGLLHAGRGQLRVTGCVFRANNGNGAVTSFDSIYTGCNFGGNGIGGAYVNVASCDGAGNKSYNNGANPQWASGSNYAAGKCVMYGGAMYRAINATTNDTVAPPSDTTNWAAVTASAPQAWGTGFYFDAGASECTWTGSDAQENAASDYYLHECLSVSVQGVSANTAYQAASNPNDYSSLVLDGALGCLADISFARLNSIAYVLRVVNSATRNDVRMTGDTTYQAVLSPDSTALPGSGNSVSVNGVTLAASLTSPALTGTPTAPTATALTNSTQLATTAYADSAVAVEKSRAQTAEALLAPLASPALTGTPTAPTATGGTNTTQVATTAFVEAALPSLPVSIANGGTGAATAPQNDVFAGPASGGSGAPSYRGLVAADPPTVPVAKGGTGQTTAAAAFNALNPNAAPAGSAPANPTGTTSASLVMMGLALAYTPASSGILMVTITGIINNTTSASNLVLGPRYGTGTAPVNGAAVTGTRFGPAADLEYRTPTPGGNFGQAFAVTALITGLTPATAYWFDFALSTATGSTTASLYNISAAIAELPVG